MPCEDEAEKDGENIEGQEEAEVFQEVILEMCTLEEKDLSSKDEELQQKVEAGEGNLVK